MEIEAWYFEKKKKTIKRKHHWPIRLQHRNDPSISTVQTHFELINPYPTFMLIDESLMIPIGENSPIRIRPTKLPDSNISSEIGINSISCDRPANHRPPNLEYNFDELYVGPCQIYSPLPMIGTFIIIIAIYRCKQSLFQAIGFVSFSFEVNNNNNAKKGKILMFRFSIHTINNVQLVLVSPIN